MAIRRAARLAPAQERRATGTKPGARPRTFWDDLAGIGRSVPAEELALLPSAARLDEHLDSTRSLPERTPA